MTDENQILRVVSGDERIDALAAYAAVIPNVNVLSNRSPARLLEKRRIVYEIGGLWSLPVDHVEAITAAASDQGETHAFVHHPNAGCDLVEVDLRLLTDFLAVACWRSDEGDISVEPDHGWPPEVISVLEPLFVDEWSMFSTSGNWIFASFMAGDENAMAGSAEFMDRYMSLRPQVVRDCVTWSIGDGAFHADSEWPPYTSLPWWKRIARSSRRRSDQTFRGSYLEAYLREFYSPESTQEIWGICERADALGAALKRNMEPDARFDLLVESDPGVMSGLNEIWMTG